MASAYQQSRKETIKVEHYAGSRPDTRRCPATSGRRAPSLPRREGSDAATAAEQPSRDDDADRRQGDLDDELDPVDPVGLLGPDHAGDPGAEQGCEDADDDRHED